MKTHPLPFFICLLAGYGLLPGSAGAAPSADLKVQWTVGKKYDLHMELNQTTQMQFPNMPSPKNIMNLTQDFSLSALRELDGGGHLLELEFGNEKIDVGASEKKMISFDSSQPVPPNAQPNPVTTVLRQMVGAHLQYETNDVGEVQKVDGIEDLMNRLSNGQPQALAMFGQMFNPETLKQYGSFADTMPNRIVNVGETWPINKTIITPVGPISINLNYAFKNWEQHNGANCARLEFTGAIAAADPAAKVAANAPQIQSGKVSGTVWFDPNLGMMQEMNNNQDVVLGVMMQGHVMPTVLNQKITLKLVKTEDAASMPPPAPASATTPAPSLVPPPTSTPPSAPTPAQ